MASNLPDTDQDSENGKYLLFFHSMSKFIWY